MPTSLTAMPHSVIANMIYQVVIYCIIFMHLRFEDWCINYWQAKNTSLQPNSVFCTHKFQCWSGWLCSLRHYLAWMQRWYKTKWIDSRRILLVHQWLWCQRTKVSIIVVFALRQKAKDVEVNRIVHYVR